MNNKKQKNLIIASLIVVVLVMSVAFAVFTTNLTINGTSSINSNWCVGFDSSKTNAYTATAGIANWEVPTGSMSYSGNTCQTSYKTNASLSATFTQPGDKLVYTLTIANKGSLDAVLDNIKVENEKITSTKTIKKKNVIFTVEMPKSLNLAANTGTTTMTVTAEFQNISDISNYTSSETQSINIELTATQNALAGGTEESFTGTLYSKSTDSVNVGDSVLMQAWCAVRKASQGYCSVNESEEYDSCTDEGWGYLDYDECLADIAGWKGATCEPGTVPVYNSCIDGDNYFESFESCQNDIPDENYTCEQGYEVIDMKKYLEFISSNYVYLKHNVVNGFIESNEVCLSSDGTNELACVSANNLENSRDTFASVLGNESYNENDKVYTYSKKINYSTFISTIDFGGNVRVRRSHGCGQYDLCILNSDGSASCLYNQSDPNAMC